MMYLCYIKYTENVVTCVPAVGDDELDVGNSEDALSEDAEEGRDSHAHPESHVIGVDL